MKPGENFLLLVKPIDIVPKEKLRGHQISHQLVSALLLSPIINICHDTLGCKIESISSQFLSKFSKTHMKLVLLLSPETPMAPITTEAAYQEYPLTGPEAFTGLLAPLCMFSIG